MKKSSVSTLAFAIAFCTFASAAGAETLSSNLGTTNLTQQYQQNVLIDDGITGGTTVVTGGTTVVGGWCGSTNPSWYSSSNCNSACGLGYTCQPTSSGSSCYHCVESNYVVNNTEIVNQQVNFERGDVNLANGNDVIVNPGNSTPTNTSKVNCPSNMTASGDCCCVLK